MTKKAWRLIFGEGLLDNFLEYYSVWTFRKYSPGSHEFTKGQIIEGHFKDRGGLTILLEVLEDTIIKPFNEITEEECQAWGECSWTQMIEIMSGWYPDLNTNDIAALICCRIVQVGDKPAVNFLPELPNYAKK